MSWMSYYITDVLGMLHFINSFFFKGLAVLWLMFDSFFDRNI